jgi:hypothetical protein
MRDDWLAKYPRAAAMLQRDDDVLLYAPQHSRGLDRPAPMPDVYWLPDVVEIWQPDREVRIHADENEELDRGDW